MIYFLYEESSVNELWKFRKDPSTKGRQVLKALKGL